MDVAENAAQDIVTHNNLASATLSFFLRSSLLVHIFWYKTNAAAYGKF